MSSTKTEIQENLLKVKALEDARLLAEKWVKEVRNKPPKDSPPDMKELVEKAKKAKLSPEQIFLNVESCFSHIFKKDFNDVKNDAQPTLRDEKKYSY